MVLFALILSIRSTAGWDSVRKPCLILKLVEGRDRAGGFLIESSAYSAHVKQN
jgi:hypothetical protein